MLSLAWFKANLYVIGALVLFNVFSAGGAYMYGRKDGRALERAAAMAAAIKVAKSDEVARAAQAADNRAEIETEAKRELTNDEIEADILRPVSGDDASCLDGGFVRDLERIH